MISDSNKLKKEYHPAIELIDWWGRPCECYAIILRLPGPREKKTEPVTDDLGGEATTGSRDNPTTMKVVAG